MEWVYIIFIIVAAVLFAISSFVDNFITDAYFRGRRPEAQKVFGLIFYVTAITLMLIFVPPQNFSTHHVFLLILSGIIDATAGIFYYRALAGEETTGVTILLQLLPVYALISGYFILNDTISPLQLFAIFLLILSAFLIVLSRGKSKLKVQLRTVALLLLTMLLMTTANTIFILNGEQFDFSTSFFFIILGAFIGNLRLVLIMKSWRTRAKNVLKEFKSKPILTILAGHGIWLIGKSLWALTLLAVPIALATAVESTTQLIATFVLGLVLTIVWPRFGREHLTKRTVLSHLVALILSTIAILLIQFT